MIIKDLTYKWVSLSDTLSSTTKIVVLSVDKSVQLRTATFDKANYHGANSSYTLASWRLFTINWVIHGATKTDRWTWQNILNGIIKPESIPSETNKGFYDLTWKNDNWQDMKASCKVYSMPKYSHENGSPLIEFEFELYSEDATYTGTTDNTANGWYGIYGGVALPTPMSFELNDYIGEFSVNNLWNFSSKCKIQVVGAISSPKIQNITMGQYYGVFTATTNFIVDARSTPIITDNGTDISAYRMSGSQYIEIIPWINSIILQGSDYSADSTVAIIITYKDTYISS